MVVVVHTGVVGRHERIHMRCPYIAACFCTHRDCSDAATDESIISGGKAIILMKIRATTTDATATATPTHGVGGRSGQ